MYTVNTYTRSIDFLDTYQTEELATALICIEVDKDVNADSVTIQKNGVTVMTVNHNYHHIDDNFRHQIFDECLADRRTAKVWERVKPLLNNF